MKRTSQFCPQTTNSNYNTHDILKHILTFFKCGNLVTKHSQVNSMTRDKLTSLLFCIIRL